jgi:hypothetical protein
MENKQLTFDDLLAAYANDGDDGNGDGGGSDGDYPGDDWTVAEARIWVEEQRKYRMVICPCCGLKNKIYKRKLNSGQALALIIFFRHLNANGTTEAQVRDIQDKRFHMNREFAKLRYWGLIAENEEERGRWGLTDKGQEFVTGSLAVPKHCYVFDDVCLGVAEDEQTTIRQALGDDFDFDELMSGYYDIEDPFL